MKKSNGGYDIFISYRRDGGETMAFLLHDRLTAKGFRVFLDVESLNAGKFNEKLLDIIEDCDDFIVILSENSLDRCVNDGDWVRNEISHAFKTKKNIVPFMLRGFNWPENLPGDIADLTMQNGINAISNEYFDAAIERLIHKFLKSAPTTLTKKVAKSSYSAKFKIIMAIIISLTVFLIASLITAAVLVLNNPDLPKDVLDWTRNSISAHS